MPSNFEIILVEPEDSLNIGSVARAMMTLGFDALSVVSPKDFDLSRAAATACWAKDRLRNIKVYSTFEDSLSSFEDVVGFSCRFGKNRTSAIDLMSWRDALASEPAGKTALVFGPESTGLREEHIDKCRSVVYIPGESENPSYNLAQAVLLAMFELRRGTWPDRPTEDLPTWHDFEQLDRLLDSVLSLSGFYREGTPGPIPGLVGQLFRRTKPNKREMAVLLGLFGRVERHFGHLDKK